MTAKSHNKYKFFPISLATATILLMNNNIAFAEKVTLDDHDTSPTSLMSTTNVTKPDTDKEDAPLTSHDTSSPTTNHEHLTTTEQLNTALPTENSNHANKREPLLEKNDPSNLNHLQKQTENGKGTLIAVIDSGFYTNHEAFKLDEQLKNDNQIISQDVMTKRKQQSSISYGKWVNDKIVFTHDYTKNTDEVFNTAEFESERQSNGNSNTQIVHGTHVAGIIGANTHNAANGVASNAQLLLMRVSVIDQSNEEVISAYVKAISDAVKLKAQVINMSFGRSTDSEIFLNKKVMAAVEEAKKAGVFIVSSAGNDGAFGGEHSKPDASAPDFGTISSPSILKDVLSVAAYVSPKFLAQTIQVNTDNGTKTLPMAIQTPFKLSNYTFSHVGLGDDFTNSNGKIAVVKRGKYTYEQLVNKAKAAGTLGIIVINDRHDEGINTPRYFDMSVGLISQNDGEMLLQHLNNNIQISENYQLIDAPHGDQMVPQSSWGVTPNGTIKPDISAPGFNIYSSSVTTSGYEYISGTSMASPHASAVLALLSSHYAKKFPNMSETERMALVKKVIMTSARPLFNKEKQAYYSPRQQGAGAINAENAMTTSYYLTDDKGNSKINLHNITENRLEMTIQIHSISNNDTTTRRLYYKMNLLTDSVDNGKISLKPRALTETNWQAIDVKPGTTELKLSLDISQFDNDLKSQMINGYFLDGFVRFKANETDTTDLLSIPFVGFRGDFTNLPALETPIYNQLENGSFYHKLSGDGQLNYFDSSDHFDAELTEQTFNNYTALKTKENLYFSAQGQANNESEDVFYNENANKAIVLGTFDRTGEQTQYVVETVDGKPYFAISPNNDGNRDEVSFQGTFLRNVYDVKVEVFDKDNNLIWSKSVDNHLIKNFGNIKNNGDGHYDMDFTTWSGQTMESGKLAKNGLYTYRISYRPASENAEIQHTDFNVLLSVETPKLPTHIAVTEQEDNYNIKLNSVSNYRTFIAYSYGDSSSENGLETNYFYADSNGNITIPKTTSDATNIDDDNALHTIDFNKLILVSEDRAGNFGSQNLSQLLKTIKDIKPKTDLESKAESEPKIESENKTEHAPNTNSENILEMKPELKTDIKIDVSSTTQNNTLSGLKDTENGIAKAKRDTMQATDVKQNLRRQKTLPKTNVATNHFVVFGISILSLLGITALFKRLTSKKH